MARMVQIAVANDVSEAEEIQTILTEAGIPSELETAVEHDPMATDDLPQKVLVPETSIEAAQEAIESAVEPDELTP
jgi:hypothetical protein